jgi:hypothetical protein
VNHLQFFLLCLAGWVNRNQQHAIEYLQEKALACRWRLWGARGLERGWRATKPSTKGSEE